MKRAGWRAALVALLTAVGEARGREAGLRVGARSPGYKPFMVSWRLEVISGPDNDQEAARLSTEINTPGSALANLTPASVARLGMFGTFPPPPYPTEAPLPSATLAPYDSGEPDYSGDTAMTLAKRAYGLAAENSASLGSLIHNLEEGSRAHAEALNYNSGEAPSFGTTTTPEPASFGEFVHAALLTTTLGPQPSQAPSDEELLGTTPPILM